MKKLSLLLALALILAMPVFSLAESTAEVGQAEAGTAQPETTTQPPYGWRGRYGQTNPATQGGFVDENQDGVCDNCGQGQGFVDEDKDGVCDNCGQTPWQGPMGGRGMQGRRGMTPGFGKQNPQGGWTPGQGMQGRRFMMHGGMMQGRRGMMPGFGSRNPQGQGRFGQANPGAREGFIDENKDGVCDHWGTFNRGPARGN